MQFFTSIDFFVSENEDDVSEDCFSFKKRQQKDFELFKKKIRQTHRVLNQKLPNQRCI